MTDYYISASIDFGKSMTFVNFYWMEIVPTDIVVVIPRMLRSVRSQLDDCKMEKMISTTPVECNNNFFIFNIV